MMRDNLDMATSNSVNFKAKGQMRENMKAIFYNMHNCLVYNMIFVLCLYRLMDASNRLYCYIFMGIHIYKGMAFEDFTKKIIEKFDISLDVMKMHYTLKFNPRVIQDLEDEDDLDNVVSHSDDFANVYLVDLPSLEAIEANIPNSQLAFRDPPITFPSSNASCDPIPNTMMLSRGFASRAADTEYIPLESIRFREAILGSGHTFKNAEEFRNAIYQMSLGGRFEYKYKKNSPTHMSVKCSVDGCPWKITAHAVEGNVILRVHTYQVNHNHIAQDECSSKVKVSSKRGAVVVEDVFRTTPDYLPRQICKDFERDHGVQLTYNQAWHLKEKAKERIYGVPRDSYTFIPWLCHRLREINPGTIAEYTSQEGHFMQLFIAHAFSIQGFIMGCQPVLAIDSCHLSGPYKGALLSAIAYDADDGMFPLALGVVSSENYEDWYWFLDKLKGVLDGKEVVIISDRHQGILRSVSELFGTGNHAYCYRHVKENFSSFFNKQNIRGKKGKEDQNGLENNPEHWAMSKFLKKRWDKMTTNIAEAFNAWLREERHQTIYTLLLMHMDKLVAMLDSHIVIHKSGRVWLDRKRNAFPGARSSKVEPYNNHFILLCRLRRLPPEKLAVVRDLQFGGLLHLNCKEIRHNICTWLIAHFNVGYRRIDITSHRSYDLTAADVGLVFGLPTTGRLLHIATTPSDHPFGTLNTCEERLLNLPIGEEFRRCFIYYACATLLAPTSRIDGCRNLWHTIHEDGFRNDVNWGQFVVDQLVEGIRRFKQGNSVWVHGCILFLQLHYVMKFKIPSVDFIKERLSAEISEFGSFGHGEAFHESSPPRTHVEDDSGPTSSNGIQDQLGIMRGLIQRLDARRKRSVHSPTAGHAGYAADDFPDAEHDSPSARYDVPFQRTEEVPDTPIRPPPFIDDDEVVVCDPLPLRSMTLARSHSNGRQRRVRRMAPNVLSPFIAQAQTRHSAIKMDLKEATESFLMGTWTPGIEELVSMHDTSLTRGNLASFQGDCWIGNDVVDAFCRMLQFDDESRTKLFLSPYIPEMVIRSNAKHLTHDAIVARFDPYMYAFDGSYQNVTQVYLPVLFKNHWTLYVYDLHNKRIQHLDSRPGRKRSCMSGIQQKLAKVVLLLVADKKQMVAVDLNMYSFVMPDVPCQPNDNDCGVFIMKFMDNWSNGGLSKSIDVAKMKKYRLKLLGRLLLSAHNAHRHRFMAV
ncbi:hypothetical protein AAG906_000742 [Vitis piasezkii]